MYGPFTKLHQAPSGKRCGTSFYEGGKNDEDGNLGFWLVIYVQTCISIYINKYVCVCVCVT